MGRAAAATDDIDAVGAILSDLQARQPAARVHFLGPWPPYSFVELPAALPN